MRKGVKIKGRGYGGTVGSPKIDFYFVYNNIK
jgi:hypothetical protein